MHLPRPIERAARFIAIPNLTVVLITFQLACMLMIWMKPEFRFMIDLNPGLVVRNHEWYRLATFIFTPISTSPLWAVFEYWIFYIMGTALEMNWGTVRYNLYLWLALLFSLAAAFIPWALGFSDEAANNGFIYNSVFLAFAFLYPDFILQLYFIFPVKIKWLALIDWLFIAYSILAGDWLIKALALASVLNFLLFFWHDLYLRIRFGRSSMKQQLRRISMRSADAPAFMHKCFICGITDRSNPSAEFRYCTECGGKCYCMTHLPTHTHNNLA